MSNDPWISTASGGRFYFKRKQKVDIGDIAVALSNICRFTGQIYDFYSVAEHSWHCSYLVPKVHALCALLHDGTEAYVNDLASPFKRTQPDYVAAEDFIWRGSIAHTFNLPQILPQCVKDADMAMLKAEVKRLYPPHVSEDLYLPGPIADVGLHLWTPAFARYHFMARFNELTGESICDENS
jgi:hypothetical protein